MTEGLQTRSRVVLVEPAPGGASCPSDVIETRICAGGYCPTYSWHASFWSSDSRYVWCQRSDGLIVHGQFKAAQALLYVNRLLTKAGNLYSAWLLHELRWRTWQYFEHVRCSKHHICNYNNLIVVIVIIITIITVVIIIVIIITIIYIIVIIIIVIITIVIIKIIIIIIIISVIVFTALPLNV